MEFAASIITVVGLGFKTASALAEVASTVKDAPQEISMCSTEVSCLAITLQHLGEIMKSNPTLCKQELVVVVNTCIGQFELQQKKIERIVKSCERGSLRLKWAFWKSRIKTTILELQGLKLTLNTALHTLTLAREHQKEKHEKVKSVARKWARIAMRSVRQSRNAVKALRSIVEPSVNDGAFVAIKQPASSALANWMTFTLFMPRELRHLSEGSSVTASPSTLERIRIQDSLGFLKQDVDSGSLDYLQIPYSASAGTDDSNPESALQVPRPLKEFELEFLRGSLSAAAISMEKGELGSDEIPQQTVTRLVTQWTTEEYEPARHDQMAIDWADDDTDDESLCNFDLAALQFDFADGDVEDPAHEYRNGTREEEAYNSRQFRFDQAFPAGARKSRRRTGNSTFRDRRKTRTRVTVRAHGSEPENGVSDFESDPTFHYPRRRNRQTIPITTVDALEPFDAKHSLRATLVAAGWAPLYTRGCDAGQTWFFGSRPVWVYRIYPEYRVQRHERHPDAPSIPGEYLLISKMYLEASVLDAYGLAYTEVEATHFSIDPWVSDSLLFSLTEASFYTREVRQRREASGMLNLSCSMPGLVPSSISMTGPIQESSVSNDENSSPRLKWHFAHGLAACIHVLQLLWLYASIPWTTVTGRRNRTVEEGAKSSTSVSPEGKSGLSSTSTNGSEAPLSERRPSTKQRIRSMEQSIRERYDEATWGRFDLHTRTHLEPIFPRPSLRHVNHGSLISSEKY